MFISDPKLHDDLAAQLIKAINRAAAQRKLKGISFAQEVHELRVKVRQATERNERAY